MKPQSNQGVGCVEALSHPLFPPPIDTLCMGQRWALHSETDTHAFYPPLWEHYLASCFSPLNNHALETSSHPYLESGKRPTKGRCFPQGSSHRHLSYNASSGRNVEENFARNITQTTHHLPPFTPHRPSVPTANDIFKQLLQDSVLVTQPVHSHLPSGRT